MCEKRRKDVIAMALSVSIKVLRQKSLMSQITFAKELNVSPTTVNRWETGKVKPNLTAMKAIKTFCEQNGYSYSDIEKEWLDYENAIQWSEEK